MQFTIRTDDGMMTDIEAGDVADALDQFDAPADVRDAAAFQAWLERVGGYGWIEQDGERIADVPA